MSTCFSRYQNEKKSIEWKVVSTLPTTPPPRPHPSLILLSPSNHFYQHLMNPQWEPMIFGVWEPLYKTESTNKFKNRERERESDGQDKVWQTKMMKEQCVSMAASTFNPSFLWHPLSPLLAIFCLCVGTIHSCGTKNALSFYPFVYVGLKTASRTTQVEKHL